MESHYTIRGASIHSSYFVAYAFWLAFVVVAWPIVIVALRRAYLSYSRSERKYRDHLVYWVQLGVDQLLITVVAIDSSGIFFDASGTVNLVCLLEFATITYSIFIYTFVSSVQTYFVQSTLEVPEWIPRFKRNFLIINLILGNIALIIQTAIDRVYMSGLCILILGSEGMVIAPVFLMVVWRLTTRLKEQFSCDDATSAPNSTQSQRVLAGVRHFRRHTVASTAIMIGFAIIAYSVYIPRLLVDQTLVHSNDPEYPDFTRDRRFRANFKLNWIPWIGIAIFVYLLRRHWIKSSAYASKYVLSSGRTKSTRVKVMETSPPTSTASISQDPTRSIAPSRTATDAFQESSRSRGAPSSPHAHVHPARQRWSISARASSLTSARSGYPDMPSRFSPSTYSNSPVSEMALRPTLTRSLGSRTSTLTPSVLSRSSTESIS